VPIGGCLKRMSRSNERLLREMRSDQLHAERHLVRRHTHRQGYGRTTTKIKYGSETQDAQENLRIGSVFTHFFERRYRHRHRWNKQQVDIFKQGCQAAGKLQPLMVDCRDSLLIDLPCSIKAARSGPYSFFRDG
jgi:alanine racemase